MQLFLAYFLESRCHNCWCTVVTDGWNANLVCMLIMCYKAMYANSDTCPSFCCSACEWHLLHLPKFPLRVLWYLTLFRRYFIPYYVYKKCWLCLWPLLVVQIVSHHVNLYPTFLWSYLLLALSMYVNSIDKCKDCEWLVFTHFQEVCEACISIELHWLWSGNIPHQRVCGYFWWWKNNLLIVSWPSLITRRYIFLQISKL